MSHIIRIVLGIALLVGTLLAKTKAAATLEANGDAGVVIMMGREMSPSSLNMILLLFTLLSVAFIAMGVIGLIKQNK